MVGAPLLKLSRLQRLRTLQFIDRQILRNALIRDIARGVQEAGEAQQLGQMFGAVPSVKLLFMRRVDVGIYQENSTSFLRHGDVSCGVVSAHDRYPYTSTLSCHSIDIEALAGNIPRLLRGEEDDSRRLILGVANPPERNPEAKLRWITV
jgi:hypothetical protein